jgi:hypothetical protein
MVLDWKSIQWNVALLPFSSRITGSKIVSNSFLSIFNLMLYSAILHSLHIKIKFIAYICHEICSSYKFFNDMLKIINPFSGECGVRHDLKLSLQWGRWHMPPASLLFFPQL